MTDHDGVFKKSRFRRETWALLAADINGYTRLVAGLDAVATAELLDRHYVAVTRVVEAHGGRVVKFMGDGCLAVFPAARCGDAVTAAEELLALELADRALELAVNVHIAEVAAGEIGPAHARRWDVIGAGVNDLFRMGHGPGIGISEAVHARLPEARRDAWVADPVSGTYRRGARA
jgi:adenylate cyclase